jgi:hypothetical protein
MGRWLIVRVVAWCLREPHGHPRASIDELDQAMRKALPHRDWTWRASVYEDAQARNRRKLAVR